MKKSNFLLYLGLTFLGLQGPDVYNFFFFIGTISIISALKFKIILKKDPAVLLAFLIPFTVLGIFNSNPALLRDFKNWLFWIIAFYLMLNIAEKFSTRVLLKALSFSIYCISFVYITVLLIPDINIYANDFQPLYKEFRTPGPALNFFLLFQVIYLFNNLKIDKSYWFASLLSLAACIINGGLQYLILLLFIMLMNVTKYSFRITIIAALILSGFLVVSYKILPHKQREKIDQITNPINSPTIQTRIRDVAYVLTNNKNSSILFGEGLGVRSEVFRLKKVENAKGDYKSFPEIDNGFYYIYHRMGILGLFALVFIFIYIQKGLSFKLKIFLWSYFFISNLLSIHFYTLNSTALIFSYILFVKWHKYEYSYNKQHVPVGT